jgi:VWFA-related protein
MRFQATAVFTAIVWFSFAGRTQEVSQTAVPTVIKTETRLVLVDSVVTDKKGNYVPNLTQKDFKVYEDNKEQPITSFNFEADPASPDNNRKHYLVLFFDNASVGFGDQMQARNAAQKFVDNNTGPNKFIAVVNFSGSLNIAQNFTNDADRLREVISGVKSSTVSTTDRGPGMGSRGTPSLSAAAQYGINSVLLGLRSLAKSLAEVPGRKMIVMLTAGFPLNDEVRSELTATIDACNKSNVSVYPVDVRGLVTPSPGMGTPGRGRGGIGQQNPPPLALVGARPGLALASFTNSFQSRGGAGAGGTSSGGTSSGAGAGAGAGGSRGGTSGGTGSTGGTGVGGTRGGTSGTSAPTAGRGGGAPVAPVNPTLRNPVTNPHVIIPSFPAGLNDNLNALYALAEGTGGFVIYNTNDLLGGMEKIAREQDQYYIIGFAPAESAEGSCHTLHIKVDHGDNVRSRSGYCNVRQVDVLAGKPAETELEAIAAGVTPGKLGAPLELPFFYASPNVARVNVAMEIPSQSFKFEKQKGKLHSEMNIMGIAYRPDNTVGAKFSDTLKYDFDNKIQVEEFAKNPVHYESQFDIASGQYSFKVVFSAGGDNFGKIEKPLVIEPFDGKGFAVSDVALGQLRKSENDSSMEAVLIEDKVPLVALGVQAVPAGLYRFKATDPAGLYMEIYEPGLTSENPPQVGMAIKIIDRKSGAEKMSSGTMPAKGYIRPGNPMVPIILKLPIKDLPPGSYRLDVTGLDSTGKSLTRSADFEVEAATGPAVGWDKN